jgi:hypothetical protein
MEALRRRFKQRNNSMNFIPNIIFTVMFVIGPAVSLHQFGVSGSDAVICYLVVVSLFLCMTWLT